MTTDLNLRQRVREAAASVGIEPTARIPNSFEKMLDMLVAMVEILQRQDQSKTDTVRNAVFSTPLYIDGVALTPEQLQTIYLQFSDHLAPWFEHEYRKGFFDGQRNMAERGYPISGPPPLVRVKLLEPETGDAKWTDFHPISGNGIEVGNAT